MYDARTRLSDQVATEVRMFFKDKVYRTYVPRSVRLAEAPSYGMPVAFYDPSSRSAEAYMDLAKEVLARGRDKVGLVEHIT
jgi:chromosome partitioning protein